MNLNYEKYAKIMHFLNSLGEIIRWCSTETALFRFRLQIVARSFDKIVAEEQSRYYETIYALLDGLSPGYRCSFGEALQKKLAELQGSDAEGQEEKEQEEADIRTDAVTEKAAKRW